MECQLQISGGIYWLEYVFFRQITLLLVFFELFRYEWNKHGTCAAHLDDMLTLQQYFEFTVGKAREFDENVFQKLEFKPSNTISHNSNNFKRSIEELHKHQVEIKCWGRTISSVHICFDLNLKPMDCRNTYNNCNGDVILPA